LITSSPPKHLRLAGKTMKMIAVGITVAFCFGIAGTDKKMEGQQTN